LSLAKPQKGHFMMVEGIVASIQHSALSRLSIEQ